MGTELTVPLPYSRTGLDRAAARRGDPAWIAEAMADPAARVVPFWQDGCLVRGTPPAVVTVPADASAELLTAAEEEVLLGLDGAAPVFAADLSALPRQDALRLAGATDVLDVRALIGSLGGAEAALLGYARGMLFWHRRQRFCGACGAQTESRHGGHLRACRQAGCATLCFPRLEPAVIVLVESAGPPQRCLLAVHTKAADGAYATLAGFVEVGESLEEAVRREVTEETGVRVGEVTYAASQAWPFPAGLMVGFRARALSDEIEVDPTELREARWFTRAELRQLAAADEDRVPDSIEHFLIEGWLAEG